MERVKSIPGGLVRGRKVKEGGEGDRLRESPVPYGDYLGAEKEDIGLKNTSIWNVNPE